MNISQNTEGQSKVFAVTRKAAISVAVAAAIGGAVFAPAAQAMAATPTHAIPAKCGECHPDVI